MDKIFEKTIYNFAHDLKSPLTGILGNLELLRMKVKDEKTIKYTENALKSSKKLYAQIEIFLDIFKYSNKAKLIQKENILIDDIFSNLNEKFQKLVKRKNISLLFEGFGTEIFSDREVISNILEFLIETSIDYSAANSEIRIVLKTENNSFSLSVFDKGKNFPSDSKEQKLLFDVLGQNEVREKGLRTGKGFSFPYIYSVVNALNGDISFISENETGVVIKVN